MSAIKSSESIPNWFPGRELIELHKHECSDSRLVIPAPYVGIDEVKMGSELLLDEESLFIQRSLVRKVDLNGALMLQQIHTWCGAEGREIDGQIYVVKSVEDINDFLFFWSGKTIMRILTGLKNRKLVVQKSSKSLDRTNSYRVEYANLARLLKE